MSTKENLDKARKAKYDEFYTSYSDIEKELIHWTAALENQSIYCFTDDLSSNFWKYFINNFQTLQLKELVATSLGGMKYFTTDGINIQEETLSSNGDCRNEEVLSLMENRICITNPPFSILMELLPLLMNHHISFLIMAPELIGSRKNCFNYFKNDELRFGFTKPRDFIKPNGEIQKLGNCAWITSLSRIDKEPLSLTVNYDPSLHLKPDNYDCINVDKLSNIPKDYYGPMAVPITYLSKHCAKQFKILGVTKKDMQGIPLLTTWDKPDYEVYINGKKKFGRVFIQRIN